MQEVFAAIWQAAAPAIGTVVGALIIALAGYLIALVKAKTKAIDNELLQSLIERLVAAAEQTIGAGNGRAKYEWVAKQLAERGLEVDPADIEALVYWLNQERAGADIVTEAKAAAKGLSNDEISDRRTHDRAAGAADLRPGSRR